MPRWEPNARVRLVESALELFEAAGYEQTGVNEIAQRAGLTKTTFFRHFPDKREVLFAGQDAHNELLGQAIADAPADATALEMVETALRALSETMPPERQAFSVRWQAVVDANSELQERAALKRSGYLSAMVAALQARSIPPVTAAVAADLGILAFTMAFERWTHGDSPSPLVDLVQEALAEILATRIVLR